MDFLHEETPVTRLLSRFMDLILLNVFWLICSIPIVTIGASTAALYDMTMRLALHEEINILTDFFKSFVHHLKKGTLLYLLALAAGVFLAADFWSAIQWDIPFKFAFQVLILSVGYFYVATVSHAIPALAYFDEPVFQTIKHSFVLAMRNGIFTVYVMVLDLIPFILFFLFPLAFWKSLFIWMTVGVALIAWLNSLHLVRLFDPQRVKTLEEEEEVKRKERIRKRNQD